MSPAPAFAFAGKRILIAGSSSGLGCALAFNLAKQGARVTITSRNLERASTVSNHLLQLLKNQSHSIQNPFVPLSYDISNSTSVNDLFKASTNAMGEIDCAINCAGTNRDSLLMRASDAMINEIIQTNLIGSMYFARAASNTFLRQRSDSSKRNHLLFISSLAATRGNVGQSAYCASKSGLIGLTLALSKELASKSISVNCICPGFLQHDGAASDPLFLSTMSKSPRAISSAMLDTPSEAISSASNPLPRKNHPINSNSNPISNETMAEFISRLLLASNSGKIYEIDSDIDMLYL